MMSSSNMMEDVSLVPGWCICDLFSWAKWCMVPCLVLVRWRINLIIKDVWDGNGGKEGEQSSGGGKEKQESSLWLYEEFTAVWNDLIVLTISFSTKYERPTMKMACKKVLSSFLQRKNIYMRFIFHFFIMNFDLPIESITLLEEKGCKIWTEESDENYQNIDKVIGNCHNSH